METFLHCFANAVPSKWFDWLHLAEFWYNTTWHSSLQQSPFQTLYGQSPRQLGIDSSLLCYFVGRLDATEASDANIDPATSCSSTEPYEVSG
jgi:hypothetical protein